MIAAVPFLIFTLVFPSLLGCTSSPTHVPPIHAGIGGSLLPPHSGDAAIDEVPLSATPEERYSAERESGLTKSAAQEIHKLIDAGVASASAGNHAAAIIAFRRAASIWPEAGTYLLLAESYLRIGARSTAVAAYQEALRLDPNAPVATSAMKRLLLGDP